MHLQMMNSPKTIYYLLARLYLLLAYILDMFEMS